MLGLVLGARIALGRGQVHGAIEHDDVGGVEMVGEPLRLDEPFRLARHGWFSPDSSIVALPMFLGAFVSVLGAGVITTGCRAGCRLNSGSRVARELIQ